VRLYDRLFSVEKPDDVEPGHDYKENINPGSLQEVQGWVEPILAKAEAGRRFQFERKGYFFVDPIDSRPGAPVFHRIVALKDTWSKVDSKAG
jgi:glutaminyl-tRNA synthetase